MAIKAISPRLLTKKGLSKNSLKVLEKIGGKAYAERSVKDIEATLANEIDKVISESSRLIDLGKDGACICSPSHSVESDTSLNKNLAFIEVAQAQLK